mmetsp:Transcript_12085/g.50867  ORF Transcript_12085/g.50867 Transcript_12085/m.50867 type:complete len:266 (-) Transcript_12085:939-1736(-)
MMQRNLVPTSPPAPAPPPASTAAAAATAATPRLLLLLLWHERVAGRFDNVLKVAHVHREREAWDVQRRAPAEVRRERVGVERGAHEYHAQVGAHGQQVTQHNQKEILIHPSLVDFIHDDVRRAGERPVLSQLAQEDAGRAEEEPGAVRALGFEAHLIANDVTQALAALVCHALRDAHRGNPARLCAHDGRLAALARFDRLLEQELRELRRLAAARLSAHDHHLVRRNRFEQARLCVEGGQLSPEVQHAPRGRRLQRRALALLQLL